MSSIHLSNCRKRKTYAFFFVLCSFLLSNSPAWAIGADSLTVQVFTVSGTKVKYQYGTLFLKEGFIPLSTQYYVYKINVTTGGSTLVGVLGTFGSTLASGSDGTLYTTAGADFYTVDKVTGGGIL